MPFFKRNARGVRDFNIYRGHAFYVPGISGTFTLLALFIAGYLLAMVVAFLLTTVFAACLGDAAIDADNLLVVSMTAYVIMFVPPMMYAGYKSRSNAAFGTGYALDSNHFGSYGLWAVALAASVATLAASVVTDPLSLLLPEMPDGLSDAMKMMTQGPLLLSLFSVSVLAPIFEEWLCRGMVLRGLLRNVRPVWAIVISAAFFALLHLNIWQAIPAFLLGCLFGYAYYRTGSLKITMIMHCVNNTFAVIMSRPESLRDADSLSEVMSPAAYAILLIVGAAAIVLFIRMLGRIPLEHSAGNCDPVENGL